VSINLSQIFVRYPDEKDAAEVLADFQKGRSGAPSFFVARTPGPWICVCAGDNMPPPDAARALSRALEASAVWYGLAGNTLAYRLIRHELGREAEKLLVPAEIFDREGRFPIPEYRDVEHELYRKLREIGLPAEYVYLFAEEIGMAGGDAGPADAAAVRDGAVQPFRHRVPRRNHDDVRTLFDLYKEGEQTVYEMLHLHGEFDEARAQQLFRTLEAVCRRRNLPEGWKVRFLAGSARDPKLGPRLADAHARGRFTYELQPPPAE
jgi:hypothetical protein